MIIICILYSNLFINSLKAEPSTEPTMREGSHNTEQEVNEVPSATDDNSTSSSVPSTEILDKQQIEPNTSVSNYLCARNQVYNPSESGNSQNVYSRDF